MRTKKLPFIFLFLLLLSLISQNVKAEENKVLGDTSSIIPLNVYNDYAKKCLVVESGYGLKHEFYYGANKYVNVYSNNSLIVLNEQFILINAKTLKEDAHSLNVSYVQYDEYYIKVTQTYVDTKLSNTYNISWLIVGGCKVKIVFEGFINTNSTYFLDWRFWVYKDQVNVTTNELKFFDEGLQDSISFNYQDVKLYNSSNVNIEVVGADIFTKGKCIDTKFHFLNVLMGYFYLDPYFGYTSIGASQENLANPSTWACKFTMPEDGEITRISMYLYGDPCNARAYIFSDNEGYCNILLATSNELSISSAWAWRNFTISYEGTGSTDYWLFLMTDANVYVKYHAGSTSQTVYGVGGTYPNPPSPCPTEWPATYVNWELSFYATYTPSGGGEEHSYVLTETFSFSETLIYGKESMFRGLESNELSDILYIQQEKRFFPTETALTVDTIVFGKEILNINIDYFIQETINIQDFLIKVYETIIEEIDFAIVAFLFAGLAFVIAVIGLKRR